ncbi:MAG: nitroreductase family protein [Hyphomicrobiales bacterium]
MTDHAFNDTSNALSLLKTRRSIVAKEMSGEGPDASQVEELLEIAARVPDHGKLAPWRFIVFSGAERAAFGRILMARHKELNPTSGEDLATFEAARFERAGTVVCVVSKPVQGIKIPVWEQELSAGAVCQNMLIAGTAMGFAMQWLSEWYAFDEEIGKALGLKDEERVAGYIYVSTSDFVPSERPRPNVQELTTHWTQK